jgi:hypothetical protein
MSAGYVVQLKIVKISEVRETTVINGVDIEQIGSRFHKAGAITGVCGKCSTIIFRGLDFELAATLIFRCQKCVSLNQATSLRDIYVQVKKLSHHARGASDLEETRKLLLRARNGRWSQNETLAKLGELPGGVGKSLALALPRDAGAFWGLVGVVISTILTVRQMSMTTAATTSAALLASVAVMPAAALAQSSSSGPKPPSIPEERPRSIGRNGRDSARSLQEILMLRKKIEVNSCLVSFIPFLKQTNEMGIECPCGSGSFLACHQVKTLRTLLHLQKRVASGFSDINICQGIDYLLASIATEFFVASWLSKVYENPSAAVALTVTAPTFTLDLVRNRWGMIYLGLPDLLPVDSGSIWMNHRQALADLDNSEDLPNFCLKAASLFKTLLRERDSMLCF